MFCNQTSTSRQDSLQILQVKLDKIRLDKCLFHCNSVSIKDIMFAFSPFMFNSFKNGFRPNFVTDSELDIKDPKYI